MPVLPYSDRLFQTHRDLYQFLSHCQQISHQKTSPQIISFSLKVDSIDFPIDPLFVLDQIATPEQLSFYFEKQDLNHLTSGNRAKSEGVAIAAIASAKQFSIAGRDRFQQAKQFMQTTLAETIVVGDLSLPFAGPHFFCSFAFSDDPKNAPCSAVCPSFPAALVFLPSWQISAYEREGNARGCTVVANLSIDASTSLESTVDSLWQTFDTINALSEATSATDAVTKNRFPSQLIEHQESLKQQDVGDPEAFQSAVRSALDAIQTDQYDKIVLAQAVDVISPVPFDCLASLHNLRRRYPGCYLFATSHGCGQQFIGASPERLVKLRRGELITDALAGSAPRGQTASEDARLANTLLNSTKEMHEHQVVLDFILGQLSCLGLTPQHLPLRLVQLSNIQHLHTPIQATVPAQIHLLDIVAALHPTPAVAGMPREITCKQIRRYEPFERSLYAGPIGWINHAGEGEFAVGIRSALIDGSWARLYAGAGIVAGSDPARELAEVQLKLQALLAALV
jgi:menaquinone-specific isochorismate synthase